MFWSLANGNHLVVSAASHVVWLAVGDKESLMDLLFLGLHLPYPDPRWALIFGLMVEKHCRSGGLLTKRPSYVGSPGYLDACQDEYTARLRAGAAYRFVQQDDGFYKLELTAAKNRHHLLVPTLQ